MKCVVCKCNTGFCDGQPLWIMQKVKYWGKYASTLNASCFFIDLISRLLSWGKLSQHCRLAKKSPKKSTSSLIEWSKVHLVLYHLCYIPVYSISGHRSRSGCFVWRSSDVKCRMKSFFLNYSVLSLLLLKWFVQRNGLVFSSLLMWFMCKQCNGSASCAVLADF